MILENMMAKLTTWLPVNTLLPLLFASLLIVPTSSVGSIQQAVMQEDSTASSEAARELGGDHSETPPGLTEAQAYRLLYENAVESQNQLVETIQWALGLVATIIVAVVAAQILFNYRISKQEIGELRSDLKESQTERFSSWTTKQESERDNEIEKIRDLIATTAKEFRSHYEERFNDFRKQIEGRTSLHDTKMMVLRDKVDHENEFLKAEINKNSARLWKLEDVPGNALSEYIKAGEINKRHGLSLKHVLSDISELLDQIEMASDQTIEEVKEFVSELPVDYSEAAEKIMEQLDGLDSYSLWGPQKAYKSAPTLLDYLYPQDQDDATPATD